jgi:hypothetical protein
VAAESASCSSWIREQPEVTGLRCADGRTPACSSTELPKETAEYRIRGSSQHAMLLTLIRNEGIHNMGPLNASRTLLTLGCGLAMTLCVLPLAAQPQLTVTRPARFAVSPRLADLPDTPTPPFRDHPPLPLPARRPGTAAAQTDAAVQTTTGPLVAANTGVGFDGIGAAGSAPPDTNIAVGPNHIVEVVNSRYQVFNKSGGSFLGPKSLGSLWTPLGGSCSTANAGDPVVQYDRLADRWVITQLGSVSSPYSECIAVSKTSDPTGAYSLYSYNYGSNLNDYPKIGVWPTATNSAYTFTYNLFANGQTFAGGQLCASRAMHRRRPSATPLPTTAVTFPSISMAPLLPSMPLPHTSSPGKPPPR